MTHHPTRPSSRGFAPRLIAVLALGALASGCATPIGVNRLRPQTANQLLTASVLTTGAPGAPAQEFLYRLGLSERYAEEPAAVIQELHAGLGGVDDADRLYALAELTFDYAEREDEQGYFLAAAAYAWAFLFPSEGARPNEFDPRVRTALDLYNRGVTAGLAAAEGNEVDLRARQIPLPFGTLAVSVDPAGFRIGQLGLEHFVSLADYDVRGLRNRYRKRGIGAPLAASVARHSVSIEHWVAPRSKIPVSALLRFDDPRRGMDEGALQATLELHDPAVETSVRIGDTTVPLEAETTTTLAYQLEGAPVWDFEIAGFRRGDFSLASTSDNLFMLHPYHPGRIPVVFVHGTASSPARWAEMVNELMNDPVLGARYQFWFYTYNTGNPVAYSAMGLRKALVDVRRDLDPDGTDPALDQLVVIGHSQGGLLTKMTSVDSGTRFWDNVFDTPFDETPLSPAMRDLLGSSMFVQPLPFVKRLVFVCTPHRGSFLAENFLGKIARRLVTLPAGLTKASLELVKLNPRLAARNAWRMPTAIDNMDWSNPFLRTLASLPIAPGVKAHSIIAVDGDGPPEEGDDGVVEYTSAHIGGVTSQIVVRSSHSAQGQPATIEEVRRILFEHLGEP